MGKNDSDFNLKNANVFLIKKKPYLKSSVCCSFSYVVFGAIQRDSSEFQFYCLSLYISFRRPKRLHPLLQGYLGFFLGFVTSLCFTELIFLFLILGLCARSRMPCFSAWVYFKFAYPAVWVLLVLARFEIWGCCFLWLPGRGYFTLVAARFP